MKLEFEMKNTFSKINPPPLETILDPPLLWYVQTFATHGASLSSFFLSERTFILKLSAELWMLDLDKDMRNPRQDFMSSLLNYSNSIYLCTITVHTLKRLKLLKGGM